MSGKPPIDFTNDSDRARCVNQFDKSMELKGLNTEALAAWARHWGPALANMIRVVKPPATPR